MTRRNHYNLFEQLITLAMRIIGGITHWIIRGIIVGILAYFEVEYHPKLPYYIAYGLTGFVLVYWVGVWDHLWWLPWTWFQ